MDRKLCLIQFSIRNRTQSVRSMCPRTKNFISILLFAFLNSQEREMTSKSIRLGLC